MIMHDQEIDDEEFPQCPGCGERHEYSIGRLPCGCYGAIPCHWAGCPGGEGIHRTAELFGELVAKYASDVYYDPDADGHLILQLVDAVRRVDPSCRTLWTHHPYDGPLSTALKELFRVIDYLGDTPADVLRSRHEAS